MQTEKSFFSVFYIFLRLGLTSFGGPVAHLGYFRAELVERRRWLSESAYADLIALCQFLPGPASSQVGMALGMSQHGYRGALAAWLGFTLPSAALLIAAALGLSHFGDWLPAGVLSGLKLAAAAVVAHAVWQMGRQLCPDAARITLMGIAAAVAVALPSVLGQLLLILAGALAGLALARAGWIPLQAKVDLADKKDTNLPRPGGRAWIMLAVFAVLLCLLPLWATWQPQSIVSVVDAFYRAGALVFGGGHVVLPLLQAEVVTEGWVGEEAFIAGYGLTQAVPGPLFTFAAFLGAVMSGPVGGVAGGLICLLAIFTPSFLLLVGVLPYWQHVRRYQKVRQALTGVNAVVVGLLLAAFYQPVWTSAVTSAQDFALFVLALLALACWRCPVWLLVPTCGAVGWLASFVH